MPRLVGARNERVEGKRVKRGCDAIVAVASDERE